MHNRAVFLDRDGTIIEETEYLSRREEVRILPGAARAILELNHRGYLAVVVTNQSAVARGLLSPADLEQIHQFLGGQLAAQGARVDAFYYCPHHPDAVDPQFRVRCECRKPQPGMVLRAAAELDISLDASYLIGDRLRDMEAGHRAGCRSVLVRTGYGRREEALFPRLKEAAASSERPDHVADDVLEAVHWILEQEVEV